MPGTGGILTLDLSGVVGWAYGKPEDREPLCGAWELAKGDLGRILASFDNELEDSIVMHRPVLIMAEAPLPPTAISRADVWRQQLGLAALAQTAAYRHDIRFREQAASTVRTAILGTSRFPKGEAKDFVMAYCREQRWSVPDHNAGDACILWDYSRRNMRAGVVP